jgi:hypothetical protein
MIELSEEDARALAPVLQRLQARVSRQIDLAELLRRWEAFIGEVEHGYDLTGYDYANDLATRDMLDEVVGAAPPALRDRITRDVLDSLDQRFRQSTRELSKPLRIATPARPHWWWFRAPNDVSGELAVDLLMQWL